MVKKSVLLMVVLLLLSTTMHGCSDRPKAKNEKAENVINGGFSIVKTVTNYDDFYQAFQARPTYKEWKTKFPVEYERYIDNSLKALYQTEEGWLLVTVDADGDVDALEKIHVSDKICEETLDQIKIGMTLDQVMELDPDANYPFLYASWDKYPKISYHYTKEGFRYTIFYDDVYCVNALRKEIF